MFTGIKLNLVIYNDDANYEPDLKLERLRMLTTINLRP